MAGVGVAEEQSHCPQDDSSISIVSTTLVQKTPTEVGEEKATRESWPQKRQESSSKRKREERSRAELEDSLTSESVRGDS